MPADDEPGRHGAVDGGEVRGEEGELLARGREGPAVQPGAAAGPVGGRREVRLRVEHHDVRGAVLEGVPEGGVREARRGVGGGLGRRVGGARGEGRGHEVGEAVHVVREVLLARGAEDLGAAGPWLVSFFSIFLDHESREKLVKGRGGAGECVLWDLLAIGLMVSRPDHVRLAAGDGGELPVEVLDDGGVGIGAIEEVLGREQPVVGVAQVAGVQDELVVVNGVREAADGGVVERGLDHGDRVALGVVGLDRVAVLAVHAEIDDRVEGEGPRVACRPRAEEVIHARVGRHDLVVVRRARQQPRQRHRVAVRPRVRVRD